MTESIGGYFELELHQGKHYHEYAIRLNTARNCFEYILLARNYKKVYIPYYTCEVMLQPLKKHHIAYEFYPINNDLEPVKIEHLSSNTAFLYTNYFGLKQHCVEKLALIYSSQLIVDNSQAFYASCIEGIDTFYSPRKYFGVPDGGYLYTDCFLDQDFPQDKSYMRMQHLLQRIDENAEVGYFSFRKNDDDLDNNPIHRMSVLTERLLCGIDYEIVKRKRRDNYLFLHKYLKETNSLTFDLQSDETPMVYPYMTNDISLRKLLIENRIFVATYWTNVLKWADKRKIEYALVNNLLPLPIDQRNNNKEMESIIQIVLS